MYLFVFDGKCRAARHITGKFQIGWPVHNFILTNFEKMGEIEVKAEFATECGVILAACMGDLCQETSDAIVNAANEELKHGGGLAAAISRAAGPTVQEESDAWVKKNGLVLTGLKAAYTGAGKLPCKHVVHVAGPIWRSPLGEHPIP